MQFNAQVFKKWVNYQNQKFIKEEIRMASKTRKRCSTLLDVREMQIKPNMRYYYTTIRIAQKFLKKNQYWKDVEQLKFLHFAGSIK